MADFGYLDGLKVTDSNTAELTIHSIVLPNGKSPILVGRCAGQNNKPYFNVLLRTNSRRAKIVKAQGVNASMLDENRDQDRELFPRHVITDWKDVVDSKGKPVAFSRENCEEFLQHLPDHIFDQVRDFFATPENFVGDLVSIEETEEQGKS